ncbi:interleukin 12 receptor, beta 2a, like isoform X2 [Myripristis murdjan]|uniref:interleukin 12 receptor, beta 2a, like isoform X2 n=1 Tax=Myripristis murdjan TaxID=586833 RepID=UPI001175EEC5|nr:interleukin-12 receptor subunit beta-2-like isoform X2 [Myripristis murdjan]
MARPGTRWLLSILLVLPTCAHPPGPPPPPSPPQCHIPYDEHNGWLAINCVWEPGPDPQTPTTYTLHWESEGNKKQIEATNVNGSIPRPLFYRFTDLHVWVQAKNQHGSANSSLTVFNTAKIMNSPTPIVEDGGQEPLEIHWQSRCEMLATSEGFCEVRHQAEEGQSQLENDTFHGVYTFLSPEPYTVYEFQVRCACEDHLISDWSAVHRVETAGAVPVGKLDVWRDCGMSSGIDACILIWKKLPRKQARGHILGYEVKLSYSNASSELVNISTAEPSGQLVCGQLQCHLNSSLKGVAAVTVSAYNAHCATSPAHLAIPASENDEQAIRLEMNSESLNVSWDPPPQLADNVKEYVVQYKQAGLPPGKGFDWVRVNSSQTTATVKGQFEKYTAYQVSLFTLSHDGDNPRHLSSVIGYSQQGVPSKVRSFQVSTFGATHVTLFWEPVPLLQRKGVILYYQIGIDSQVYNVSVLPRHGNLTFLLKHLSPSRVYEVWLRAVTVAGPGANATLKFQTAVQWAFGYVASLLTVIFVVIACVVGVAVHSFRAESEACPLVPWCLNEKVPDPRNSHIFRHMKHQFNGSLAWIWTPILEAHPKISQLEVVEIPPEMLKPCPEEASHSDGQLEGEEHSQTYRGGDEREEDTEGRHQYGREAYSKMIDSDEEQSRDDCLSSSDEDEFISGYEKHFMPTALEVMEG